MYILVPTQVLTLGLYVPFHSVDFVKHKRKLGSEAWPAPLIRPWNQTRKVFNLEKLNPFKAQNLKGLF